MHVDVAVLGAGPAGCAAALTLRRYLPELTVLLLDRPAAASAVGETLSPGVLPLLGYLGLDGAFLAQGHLPAGGTASAWGSADVLERSYVFSGRGQGWHLDRARFDGWLHERAVEAGAASVSARLREAEREGARWILSVEGEEMTAGAVVDATGRAAVLARSQEAEIRRDDGLVAVARWFTHDAGERIAEGALVEALPDGWWYSATLPGGRGVAMLMGDADLARGTAAERDARWDAALAGAGPTAERLSAWRPTDETAVRAANSQRTTPVVGEGWVTAGDAAAAFDPLASLGIGFALRSGMEAARVAAGMLDGDDGPAEAYADSIQRIYTDYRERLRRVYAIERRWADAPFWARRRGDGTRPDLRA